MTSHFNLALYPHDFAVVGKRLAGDRRPEGLEHGQAVGLGGREESGKGGERQGLWGPV